MAQIKCDYCSFSVEGNPPDYHGVICPQCKRCVLINDDDMEVWNNVVALTEVGLVEILPPEEVKELIKNGKPYIHIDTATKECTLKNIFNG